MNTRDSEGVERPADYLVVMRADWTGLRPVASQHIQPAHQVELLGNSIMDVAFSLRQPGSCHILLKNLERINKRIGQAD
jgi:hypothetical protein